MNKILYFISCLIGIIVLTGCVSNSTSKNLSGQDSLYSEDNILNMTLSQPEEALALLDTIEMKEIMKPYQVDFWRSIVYHNGFTNNKRARMYAQKAYNSLEIPKTSEEYLSLTMMLADVCQTSGDYAESVTYCYEGLELAKQTENIVLEASLYVILGMNMTNLHQNDEAFRNFNLAISIFKEIAEGSTEFGAWDDYIYAMGITMNSYIDAGMYKETIEFFPALEKAIEHLRNCKDVPDGLADMRQASAYSVFANIYRKNGEIQKAKYYYDLLDKIPFCFTPDCNQIRIPYLLADHRYNEALKYIKSAKDYLRENIDTVSYDYIDMYLYNERIVYESLGDIKSAYQVQKTILELKDSLRSRERQEDALELAEIYKTNKQAAQLEEQKNTIKIRTLISLFSIILLLAAVCIIVRVIRYNKIIKRKNTAMAHTIDELMDYKDELLVRQEENIQLKEELDKLRHEMQGDVNEELEVTEADIETEPVCLDGSMNEDMPAVELTAKDRELYDCIDFEIQSRQLYLKPDISKKELMKKFHIPNNKFALLFKEFAGCSFIQYIQNCKINHAVRLMREQPQWTLSAIAKESQMSNGAFYSQFQKKYGMKPSDYRDKLLSSRK